MTFIRHLIPGLLWFNFLDAVCDNVCVPVVGSNFVCDIIVATIWMFILNKIRIQVNRMVTKIIDTYFVPKKAYYANLWWSHWILRLQASGVAIVLCLTTFGLWYTTDDDEQRTSHKIVHSVLDQADLIVWTLGTLLRITEQRLFLPLLILTNVLAPLCGLVTRWCGSFALWLLLGVSIQKIFSLSPLSSTDNNSSELGMRGAIVGAIVSSIYCDPFGIQETAYALSFAIVGELLYRNFFLRPAPPQPTQKEDSQDANKSSSSKAGDEKETSKGDKGDTKKGDDSKDTTLTTEPTSRPSLIEWFGLFVLWVGLGIALDKEHY